MKWDVTAVVNPKTLPLRDRLRFAWRLAHIVTTVNGRPTKRRQRMRVFFEAFTADNIIVEEEETRHVR